MAGLRVFELTLFFRWMGEGGEAVGWEGRNDQVSRAAADVIVAGQRIMEVGGVGLYSSRALCGHRDTVDGNIFEIVTSDR